MSSVSGAHLAFRASLEAAGDCADAQHFAQLGCVCLDHGQFRVQVVEA
jgi:hypothetical protein